MIIPFKPEELFELNDNLEVKKIGDVVIVNNIFKNYDKIVEVINNMSIEIWKMDGETRNFIDYYDCRPIFRNHFPTELTDERFSKLFKICSDEFKDDNININSLYTNFEFIFNYFKNNIKDLPSTQQHRPHCDAYYNVIFYLDKINSGGTAIYHSTDVNGNVIENEGQLEGVNLLTDITHLRIKQFIEGTPNSMVMFNGKQLHGAWVSDYNKYLNDWRINLVHFLYTDGERI